MDWRTIQISDTSETFIISIVNESDGNVLFHLSNFKELWSESINWPDIHRRAKSTNELMDGDEDNVVQKKLFSPANHYNYIINKNDLLLKTKYYVGGATFQFHWNLTKCNSDVFYEEITRKLLVTLVNVEDQRNELMEIVKRKDVEISQFKAEGATLPKKYVPTQAFVKEEFTRKFEPMNGSCLFKLIDNDNYNSIKNMCNYKNCIKTDDLTVRGNTVNVSEGPSPSKIMKLNKDQEAIRKFQAQKHYKINYEEVEQEITSYSVPKNTITRSTNERIKKVATKKFFNSKLNL